MPDSRIYRTISGDMWDQIAYKTMGSSFYADKLMQANPEYLGCFIFPAGVILRIPEIGEKDAEELPLWKRGLFNE